jgi:hypothetical protein
VRLPGIDIKFQPGYINKTMSGKDWLVLIVGVTILCCIFIIDEFIDPLFMKRFGITGDWLNGELDEIVLNICSGTVICVGSVIPGELRSESA